ncbi:MAG TPA: polymer-forming cytoskeletal protein [Gemmatimonadaceae bacterium]
MMRTFTSIAAALQTRLRHLRPTISRNLSVRHALALAPALLLFLPASARAAIRASTPRAGAGVAVAAQADTIRQPGAASVAISDQAAPVARDSIGAWLDSLALDPNGLTIARDAVRPGARSVAAGETVSGSIGSWHGDLDIRGTVNGNAVAIGGDVILRPGSAVHGDVLAVGGLVKNEGGAVDGEMRSLSALTVGPVPVAPQRTPAETARRSFSLAVGWYLVLAVIGLAVVIFARGKFLVISGRIRDDFTRSFFYGVLGQIALFPALVVTIIALAITVLGILLIPFAIVGFILAAAGALALGFLAMVFVIGDAAMRWRGAAGWGGWTQLLQFLLIGLSLYLVLWVLGGALAGLGAIGGAVRFIVMVVTWVAVTVGFGATLATRGGTRTDTTIRGPGEPSPAQSNEWQTPTPVSGVAAARRPASAPRREER